MADEIKFTEEEIQKINEIRTQKNTVFTQLGQLKIEKESRLKEIENLETQLMQNFIQLQEDEKKFYGELNEKYGDGNYDPATNVFTPIKNDEQKQ